MARTATHKMAEVDAALRLVTTAENMMQLRQSQAILIPALTGATLATTATILGLQRNRVCVIRKQFRAAGARVLGKQETRGGRRRQLMSIAQELGFLKPWVDRAEAGGVLVVPPIHVAFEKAVGRKVPKSTVYRMLARHGWRKIAPDTRHPKADPAAQALFKKNLRNRLAKP